MIVLDEIINFHIYAVRWLKYFGQLVLYGICIFLFGLKFSSCTYLIQSNFLIYVTYSNVRLRMTEVGLYSQHASWRLALMSQII